MNDLPDYFAFPKMPRFRNDARVRAKSLVRGIIGSNDFLRGLLQFRQ
jgi:hypothetical protein